MPSKRSYRKAYRAWRKEGQKLHSALLEIWRAIVPDSEYGVFGEPKEVVEVVAKQLALRDHYRRAAITQEDEIHNTLAKALGYPAYEPGEPGYYEGRVNYVTGDHTAETLAIEAAAEIFKLKARVSDLSWQVSPERMGQ